MTTNQPIKKVVVFTSRLDYTVCKGIAELQHSFPDIEWLILQHAASKSPARLIRNQWRNLKKNGWRWIPYQTQDVWQRIRAKIRPPSVSSNHTVGRDYTWSAIKEYSTVAHLKVPDIHAATSVKQVTEFTPDLGISLAAPILKPPLFSIPKMGTINLHKGKLPDYRGMPPAFWESYHNEKRVGCSVHQVNQKLDNGPILLESSVEIKPYSTVKGLQLELDELGAQLMCQAVHCLQAGTATWREQPSGGRTFSKPTLKQEASLKRKQRTPTKQTVLRTFIKEIVFWSYIHLLRPVPTRLLGFKNKQRVIVLLYHRVNDDMRDSLTVGIEQFDRQMAWLSKHYPVVSIADIVTNNIPRNTAKPLVAITFDDGYLDNYQHAAPILLRHRIPAAFFVSTGIVNTQNGFPHDLEKLGKALPNMNWSQIKTMHEQGFVIGSHSVSHLDCGSADHNSIRAELIESRDKLTTELALNDVIFAYPFGRRHNMTPEALQIVKEEGFIGCLSAYGGINKNDIDRFNVLRMGIDHKFTMLAFRARLEGFQ